MGGDIDADWKDDSWWTIAIALRRLSPHTVVMALNCLLLEKQVAVVGSNICILPAVSLAFKLMVSGCMSERA